MALMERELSAGAIPPGWKSLWRILVGSRIVPVGIIRPCTCHLQTCHYSLIQPIRTHVDRPHTGTALGRQHHRLTDDPLSEILLCVQLICTTSNRSREYDMEHRQLDRKD